MYTVMSGRQFTPEIIRRGWIEDFVKGGGGGGQILSVYRHITISQMFAFGNIALISEF